MLTSVGTIAPSAPGTGRPIGAGPPYPQGKMRKPRPVSGKWLASLLALTGRLGGIREETRGHMRELELDIGEPP